MENEKIYENYHSAISPYISWIKDEIAKSSDGKIRILIKDIKEKMGPAFTNIQNISIYRGLKYVLFSEGLYAIPGYSKKGEPLLIIRNVQTEDSLV